MKLVDLTFLVVSYIFSINFQKKFQ